MILITHNLGVIAETVNRVLIMYAGQVLEEANVEDLFAEPLHPYSEGLMWSVLPLEQGITKIWGIFQRFQESYRTSPNYLVVAIFTPAALRGWRSATMNHLLCIRSGLDVR